MAATVRTQLREAIKFGLRQITTANGYRTNIRRIYDPWMSPEKIDETPAVNVLWGREERWDDGHLHGNNPLLDLRFNLMLDFHLGSVNDIPLEQDKVLADVQKYFGTNWWIPDSSGDARTFTCAYLASDPWADQGEEGPRCGIMIEIEVFYSINLSDPEVMIHN